MEKVNVRTFRAQMGKYMARIREGEEFVVGCVHMRRIGDIGEIVKEEVNDETKPLEEDCVHGDLRGLGQEVGADEELGGDMEPIPEGSITKTKISDKLGSMTEHVTEGTNEVEIPEKKFKSFFKDKKDNDNFTNL